MDLGALQVLLGDTGIIVSEIVENNKASEVYVKTKFVQDNGFEWDTYVPYVDRRAGLNIVVEQALAGYLKSLKQYFTKEAMREWRQTEIARGLISGPVTSAFFNILLSFKEEFERFPANPNPARRIQDIKDAGYTVASVPRLDGTKGYNRILLPIPLHTEMSYETFSAQFKARVIRLLNERNAFEARATAKKSLIPDHKFSEVRWNEETKGENSINMTDDEIIKKFQLLDNQRNQQKREICRKCFQEGVRGTIYGIDYFYKGTNLWDKNIPTTGKEAEKGCEGCPWYDIEEWRNQLNNALKQNGL
ncbi:MAG: hypothetical protein IJ789_07135 [Bacteroidales bacterium]|nr:hypothetical protein [Bacteroidales bacterium]